MEGQVDSRGVLRGACIQCSCSCYIQDVNKLGCASNGCGHPPGKHRRIPTAGTQQPSNGMLKDGDGFVSVESAASIGTSYSGHGMANQRFEQKMGASNFPICKAEGCTRNVYFDPTFKEFDYCSPECRDKTLLHEGHQYQLEYDLEELKKELQELVLVEMSISNKSPSLKSRRSPSTVTHPPRMSEADPTPSLRLGSRSDQHNITVKNKDCGIILSKVLPIDKSERTSRILITGVVKGSNGYELMQKNKLHLLDVVESVRGYNCRELCITESDAQKWFEGKVGYQSTTTTMSINCSQSLSLSQRLLSQIDDISASHIIVVMKSHGDSKFGFKIQQTDTGVYLEIRDVEGPAYKCGVRPNDEVCAFMPITATTKGVIHNDLLTLTTYGRNFASALKTTLSEKKIAVLFLLSRSTANTR